MIKSSIFWVFIFLSSLSLKAQTSKYFEGKWHFLDFYNSDIKDSIEVNSAKRFYTKYIIVLDSNRNYHADFLGGEKGTWEYIENSKKLIFTDIGGKEENEVIVISSNKFILILENQKGIILERLIPN